MRDNIVGGALTETTFLILLAIYRQPLHGYGILQSIEQMTRGRVVLGAGTLYGALNTLVDKGWAAEQKQSQTKRKREYQITPLGKEIVAGEMQRLSDIRSLAEQVTGEAL